MVDESVAVPYVGAGDWLQVAGFIMLASLAGVVMNPLVVLQGIALGPDVSGVSLPKRFRAATSTP